MGEFAGPMQTAKILESVTLPGQSGRLVLYDWMEIEQEAGNTHNLVCLGPNDEIIWRAAFPERTNPDCYVGIRIENGTIQANSWSCYLVTLDPKTGKILDKVFTK